MINIDFFINEIENFTKNLPENYLTLCVEFENKDVENKNYYLIDSSYKVINNKINDYLNGLSPTEHIFYTSNIYKNLDKDVAIQNAFDNNLLYAFPVYETNKNEPMKKALFLDRDGILIDDIGYIGTIERVIINKHFIDVVKHANDKGYLVVVVTNQSGVARGLYSDNDIDKVNNYIKNEYEKYNAKIDYFYKCPFHTDGINKKYVRETILRKPNAGMHLTAMKEHNIDFSKSLMIGDRDSDVIRLPYLKSYLIETPTYKIDLKDKIIPLKSIYNLLI